MTPDILDSIDATLTGWEHASADAARWTPDTGGEPGEWIGATITEEFARRHLAATREAWTEAVERDTPYRYVEWPAGMWVDEPDGFDLGVFAAFTEATQHAAGGHFAEVNRRLAETARAMQEAFERTPSMATRLAVLPDWEWGPKP